MKRFLLTLALLAGGSFQAFADGTIDTLAAASALGGTEKIPIFQGSNPAVATSPAAISTYIGSLGLYVPVTRTVSTSAPLSGGGALSSNLTLSLAGPSNLTTFTTGTVPMGASTSAFVASEISDTGSAGVVIGSPTGGAKGAGTINMTGCFVNNVACATGSAPSFSAITGGTNTSAAMVVGTGASLAVSGSGTIGATTLNGNTFANPGAIGGGTAAAGTFTTATVTTLAATTINGAALSGTFSGTPTYSGIPIFSGLSSVTCSLNVVLDSGNHLGTTTCPAGGGGTSAYTAALQSVMGATFLGGMGS